MFIARKNSATWGLYDANYNPVCDFLARFLNRFFWHARCGKLSFLGTIMEPAGYVYALMAILSSQAKIDRGELREAFRSMRYWTHVWRGLPGENDRIQKAVTENVNRATASYLAFASVYLLWRYSRLPKRATRALNNYLESIG